MNTNSRLDGSHGERGVVVVGGLILLTLVALGLVTQYVAIVGMGRQQTESIRISDLIRSQEERLRELQGMGAQDATLLSFASLPEVLLNAYTVFQEKAVGKTPIYRDPALARAAAILAAATDQLLGSCTVEITLAGRPYRATIDQRTAATLQYQLIKHYLLPELRNRWQQNAMAILELQKASQEVRVGISD